MRKTERRLPTGFQASDLGQSVVADGRCTLISFATAPVVVACDNGCAALVTDPSLASVAHSFEWTFTENGTIERIGSTNVAETLHTPASIGTLTIAVRVLDAGTTELAALSLDREVCAAEPGARSRDRRRSDPARTPRQRPSGASRAHQRDCRYQQATLQTPEPGDGFLRFLFSMVLDGAVQYTAAVRRQQPAELAAAVSKQPQELARLRSGSGYLEYQVDRKEMERTL